MTKTFVEIKVEYLQKVKYLSLGDKGKLDARTVAIEQILDRLIQLEFIITQSVTENLK